MTAHRFNDLLCRLYQGDMSALEPIYLEYYKSMCGQAMWIVRNSSDAQDVASDVMIKILGYAQNADRAYVKDVGAFLYTLTRNAALDTVRKRKFTAPLDLADVPTPFDEGIDKAVIFSAVKTLSEQQFKIAEMFYYYDCKIKTIAQHTGLTVSAVKYHLSEIRKKLYKILKTD